MVVQGTRRRDEEVSGKAMHALIIEDDYLIGRTIEDVLGTLGFRSFSFARSEDAAIAAARDRLPDLIAADLRLLPGNGVAAVEAIKAKRHVPVVFVTGYAPDLEEQMPDANVVNKPVKHNELAAAVKRALAESGASTGG